MGLEHGIERIQPAVRRDDDADLATHARSQAEHVLRMRGREAETQTPADVLAQQTGMAAQRCEGGAARARRVRDRVGWIDLPGPPFRSATMRAQRIAVVG